MEKTTPSNSPLHRGRNGRKETLQCNTQHILPLCKGELEGVVKPPAFNNQNLKSKH